MIWWVNSHNPSPPSYYSMSGMHSQESIFKLVQRVEALEREGEKLRQEMDTLKKQVGDMGEYPAKPVRQTIPRPRGEANRSGKKGGKSDRKGFNVQQEVHAVNPNMDWNRFTVSFIFVNFMFHS